VDRVAGYEWGKVGRGQRGEGRESRGSVAGAGLEKEWSGGKGEEVGKKTGKKRTCIKEREGGNDAGEGLEKRRGKDEGRESGARK